MALGVIFTHDLKIIFKIEFSLWRWLVKDYHIKTFIVECLKVQH